jgi:CBS domain-containing protein
MKTSEIMTPNVVSVRPETPAAQIASVLLANGISAVPVTDGSGVPIGIVSEGDLIGRNEADREARRDWWLALLAEGESISPEFIAGLQAKDRAARDVMSAPVITVDEHADVRETAQLLQSYHIKRVPVVRDGRVVGIVSRADLLRALAQQPPASVPRREGLLSSIFAGIDERFARSRTEESQKLPSILEQPDDTSLDVVDFRRLVEAFERREICEREAKHRAVAEQRRQRVSHLIDEHVSDEGWRAILHQARAAAEHGEKERLLLQFPSQLCSDGGRAINVSEPSWPATLRGDAAEIYLRWERDLKPRGFRLLARVLDFPDGVPGDIGLFLVWE